jgi:Tol biopolymer transport system component
MKKYRNLNFCNLTRIFLITALILMLLASHNYIMVEGAAYDPYKYMNNNVPHTSLQRTLDSYGKGTFCASCHSMSYPSPHEEYVFVSSQLEEMVPRTSNLYGSIKMEPGLKRLTTDPGRDVGAVYNPKGDKIIWVSDRFGNWTIWAMNEDGSEKKQLTSESVICGWPSWSPDGSEFAYWSWDPITNTGDIWKMSADGSLKTQLTTDGSFKGPPKWSPKGDRITYTGDLTGDMEIYLMNSDGSDNRQLTKDHNPNYWIESRVTWHPDGQRLYYQVTTFPLPENVKTKIIDDVAFVEIFVINVDIGYEENLTPELHENVRSVSPDGEKLACISLRSPNYGLWVMDDDGGNQTPLTWDSSRIQTEPHFEALQMFNVGDRAPIISPDSKKIVYWSLESNNQPDIWMINIDGSDKTKLTTNLFQDVYPSWSPDGKKIIFESDRADNFDIWSLSLENEINVDLDFVEFATPGDIGEAVVTVGPQEGIDKQLTVESIALRFDWDSGEDYKTYNLEMPHKFESSDDSYKAKIEFTVPEDISLGYRFYDVKVQYSETGTSSGVYEHSAKDLEVGLIEQKQCYGLNEEISNEIEQLYEMEIDRSRVLGEYTSESPEPLAGYFEFLNQPESEYYVKASDELYDAQNKIRIGEFEEGLASLQRIKMRLEEERSQTLIEQDSTGLLLISAAVLILVGAIIYQLIPKNRKKKVRK